MSDAAVSGPPAHDALVAELSLVLDTLRSGDAVAAEPRVAQVFEHIQAADNPLGDARVRPLIEECMAAADALRGALEDELRRFAASGRAAAAYGAEP